MKNITLSLIIFSLAFAPGFAMAGWPATDVGNAGTHAANLGTNANAGAQQVLKTVKDYGLDVVAYTLAQKLGQKMASLAINKANGGASKDKDPDYVKEFGTIFSQIEQQQRDIYTTKLLSNTTNPYAKAIAQDMLQSPYADQLGQFTLGNFMKNGADISTAKEDLSSVGENGLAFFASLGNPANTPAGSSLIAQNQLASQIADKARTENLKLTSGGFKPNTKCTSTISDFKLAAANSQQANTAMGALTAAKMNLDHARAEYENAGETYGADSPEAHAAQNTYNAAEASANQSIQQQNDIIQSTLASKAGTDNKIAPDVAGCIEEFVKNPIGAVQTITTDAGKFGMDMTKNISGWGQIVAGLFVSLFNGFINTGLASLKSDYGQKKAKQSNTGGPEQLSQKTLGGGVEASTNIATAPTVIVDLRSDLETSLLNTEKNMGVLNKVADQLLLVPGRLSMLDICLPGPEMIGLDKRLEKYYDQQTAWIQKVSMMGDDKKNNTDQTLVISMLEQDFAIARAEMTQDMTDDTRNIPGASVMRAMIGTFQSKKALLQNTNESIIVANNALTQLRDVNTQLKNSITLLKQLEPNKIGTLPGVIFTTSEWDMSTQADRDAIYNWMKAHSPNKPVEVAGLSAADVNIAHRKYVIKNSWDLWEYPFQFFPATGVLGDDGQPALDASGNPITDKKWSDETSGGASAHADEFLDKKNEIRSSFNAIKDIIPTEWEISKNEQTLAGIKSEILRTDNLIHDCDMMRYLIIGGGHAMEPMIAPDGAPAPYANKSPSEMLADMSAHKETYFKSDEVRNSLTLPSIFTRFTPPTATPEQEGCRPYHENDYPADFSPVKNIIGKLDYGGQQWVCMGSFGHIYGVENEGDVIDFSKWIDEGGNAYDSIPYISWPSELFWKSRLVKFIPPPVPDTYGKGWSSQNIANENSTDDDGFGRPLFCRNSGFMRVYGIRSGLAHPQRNFYCSSKWADLTVSQALGLFLITSLN